MNSKYRVVSITWVDVYASDMDEARKLAGDIYYNMTPEEHDALPSVALTRPYGDDDVYLEADDMPGWTAWSPSNDPF